MSNLPSSDAEFNLQQVLLLGDLLTQWLVRSGVGYMEFSAALKPFFYQQALQELHRLEQKPTVSAISLLSGLHRKDVTAYKGVSAEGKALHEASVAEPMSVPARVIGLWIGEGLPMQLQFHDMTQTSFETLVKRISTERHPRSVLNELIRLGVVEERESSIFLKKGSYIPDRIHQESRQLLTQNLQHHIQAGLHNIFQIGSTSRLEESVTVDELSVESVEILKQKSIDLWEICAKELMELAIQRCEQDKANNDATHTFCLGIYQNES